MYIQLLTKKTYYGRKGYYSACLKRMRIVFLNSYNVQTINYKKMAEHFLHLFFAIILILVKIVKIHEISEALWFLTVFSFLKLLVKWNGNCICFNIFACSTKRDNSYLFCFEIYILFYIEFVMLTLNLK